MTDVTGLDMALARSPLVVNLLERLADLEAKAFAGEPPWEERRRVALGLANAQEAAALRARLAELTPAAPKK